MTTPFPDWLPPLTHLPNGWPLPPMPPLPPRFPEPVALPPLESQPEESTPESDPPRILKHCLICDTFLHVRDADVCRQCKHEQEENAYQHHWLFLTARYLRGELRS